MESPDESPNRVRRRLLPHHRTAEFWQVAAALDHIPFGHRVLSIANRYRLRVPLDQVELGYVLTFGHSGQTAAPGPQPRSVPKSNGTV